MAFLIVIASAVITTIAIFTRLGVYVANSVGWITHQTASQASDFILYAFGSFWFAIVFGVTAFVLFGVYFPKSWLLKKSAKAEKTHPKDSSTQNNL